MPEAQSRQVPWLRVFVEGMVIVASVLLALAADAWWDGRQLRQEEITTLEGLRADFEATLEVIVESRQGYQSSAGAADALISLTGDQAPTVSSARVDTLLALAITGTAFTPVEATLTALLSSGTLGLVSNGELRGELAEWAPRMARIRRSEEQNSRQILDHFMPYLYERVPIRALDALSRPELGTRPSGFVRDTRALLSDLRFENGLNDVLFYHQLLTSLLNDLEDYVQTTLAIIDQELER